MIWYDTTDWPHTRTFPAALWSASLRHAIQPPWPSSREPSDDRRRPTTAMWSDRGGSGAGRQRQRMRRQRQPLRRRRTPLTVECLARQLPAWWRLTLTRSCLSCQLCCWLPSFCCCSWTRHAQLNVHHHHNSSTVYQFFFDFQFTPLLVRRTT